MVQQHRTNFEAVRHAHRVTVAEKAWFQMSGKIEEGDALREILADGFAGPGGDVCCSFGCAITSGERGSEKFVHVAFKKQHAHGELRGNKGIVCTHQVRELAPAKWKIGVIE